MEIQLDKSFSLLALTPNSLPYPPEALANMKLTPPEKYLHSFPD